MDHIRIATPEELEALQAFSDITPRSMTFCLDEQKAVVRNIYELEPYIRGNATKGQVAKFFWGLEERLIGAGVDAYYFSIEDTDEFRDWRELVKNWGAEEITPKPSRRYKRLLIKHGN